MLTPTRRTFGLLLAAMATRAGGIALAEEARAPLRIGHYSAGTGTAGFVLDRLGTPIKLRFDGSPEIWALSAEPAARGAISLKRDDGSVLLRAYDSGRVILFDTAGNDVSAYRDQSAEPLAIAPATKPQAEDNAVALGQQLKRAGGSAIEVVLDAPQLGARSDGWSAMADAAAIAGIALKDVLADPIGRETVAAKLRRVVIRDSGRVAVDVVDRALIIEIAADKPILGRPSSARLRSAIGDLLQQPNLEAARASYARVLTELGRNEAQVEAALESATGGAA